MSRKRRDSPEAALRDAERQAADLAAFRRMLEISSGTFSLSFAICDDRKLRDSLVERFATEFPGTVVVHLPTGEESIYTNTAAQIGLQIPTAIFVLDIEASVPFGSASQPTLRVLNSSREHWERFRCPVVFWLAEYAITLLHRHAPDFWRYRSHQFEFVPEIVPLTDLKTESFSGFPMVDVLPFEEKAFRATELERRLREAGDPPPADLLPHVLTWIYELAHLYRHSSRLREAESLLCRTSEWTENYYGDDHPLTGKALNNLAEFLRGMNRAAEAEPLMRRSLNIFEKNFGRDDSRSIRVLGNLALLLQETNRQAEAEQILRQVVEAEEAINGPEAPAVGVCLNNLATLLKATMRLSEAENALRRAVNIFENSYGPDHPMVATGLNNLAATLQDSGRLEEAAPLLQRALVIDEKSYGPDHPDVARDLTNLAMNFIFTGKWGDAEPLIRRSLRIFANSFGREHPNSKMVEKDYKTLLQALKVPEEEIEARVKSAASGSVGSGAD